MRCRKPMEGGHHLIGEKEKKMQIDCEADQGGKKKKGKTRPSYYPRL